MYLLLGENKNSYVLCLLISGPDEKGVLWMLMHPPLPPPHQIKEEREREGEREREKKRERGREGIGRELMYKCFTREVTQT